MHDHDYEPRCGCGCDRRGFLAAMSTTIGGLAFTSLVSEAAQSLPTPAQKEPATVRVAFLYPPSKTFAENADGWWSWPGNGFDAEGRQKQYTAALGGMEGKLGIRLVIANDSIADAEDAVALAKELEANRPDGLLLVMFYNNSLPLADTILKAAEKLQVPAVFYIGLGVKHQPVKSYRRPGLYLIQSLDNFEAIEYGLRMIHARKRLSQTKLLCIRDAKEPQETATPYFGTRLRVIPFARYAADFAKLSIDADARKFLVRFTSGATERRQVTDEALENAARAHFAIKKLLAEERADGLTMVCLQRGMLKPCISFAALNGQLIPAACEGDIPALHTLALGSLLVERPGFMHNPAYETERNHFYASHCTCAPNLYGRGGTDLPFLLRRFTHSNEGSCAIQVFWKSGDPVTMVRWTPGMLDVYAGEVYKSHPMPPAGGCTTNVEVRVTDREDASMVVGHHNVMFCGDFARKFRLFAQLHRLKLAETGFKGIWPL
jgi:hypothetical protein